MELVDPACFMGLPPDERWQQIYLALGGTPECFMESPFLGQLRLILDQIGSEECIYSPEDFWRAWAAHLGIECVDGVNDAKRQIYAYYYNEAGDDTLTDPSCFPGLPPDLQMQALFSGVLAGATPVDPPVNLVAPVISGDPVPDSELTVSTGTWSGGGITYSYQWKLNGVNVGTDQNTYTVPSDAADGDEIYCVVTATNTAGSASANSNTVAVENAFDPTAVMDFVWEADYGVLKQKTGTSEPTVAAIDGTIVTLYSGGNEIDPGDWIVADNSSITKRAAQVASRTSDTEIILVEPNLHASAIETGVLICVPVDTDGDVVAAWVTRNPGGICACQSDLSKRPLWYSTGGGGEPFAVLVYDGIDDYLSSADNLGLLDLTVIFKGTAPTDTMIWGGSANQQVRVKRAGSNVISFFNGDGTIPGEVISDALAASLDDFGVLMWRRESDTVALYQHGVQYGGGSEDGAMSLEYMGCLQGSMHFYGGEMAANFVKDGAISSEDADLVHDYLA